MTPADDGGWRDELAPEPLSSHVAPMVVVAVVVIAALAALAALVVATRPAHRHHATAPRPKPLPTVTPTVTPPVTSSPSPETDIGSVLTNGIAACTHTDHRARVDVAMSLTNLSNLPLRIVSAAPAVNGLRVTALHVGGGRCGETASTEAARLRPGHDVVVALRFEVGSPCPLYGEVVATLTIDAGGRAVHTATPSLADLRSLGVAGC